MSGVVEATAVRVEPVFLHPLEPTMTPANYSAQRPGPDLESRAWVADLADEGATGDGARARLHGLLLKATRFEINRRRSSHPHLRGGDLDDLAHQAAADAMVAVLAKLESYRGDSRFSTWAYKFALLEAAVKLRR